MRAFVIDEPGRCAVREVPDAEAGPRDVLVRVTRVGLCGTDRELIDGTLSGRLGTAVISFPRIPGHEWAGVVERVGEFIDPALIGRRVFGDTFVGCGFCRACRTGNSGACSQREEIGVRGRDGALAELVAVPAANALPTPDEIDDSGAALIEPLSNAVRALAEMPDRTQTLLVRGAGALGILTYRMAQLRGIGVTIVDTDPASCERARSLAVPARVDVDRSRRYDAVIEMAPVAEITTALRVVRDGGVIVMTGFPSADASLPVRQLVERDIRVIGALGASAHLATAAALAASSPSLLAGLTAEPIDIDDVAAAILRGTPRLGGPIKTQVDPQRRAA